LKLKAKEFSFRSLAFTGNANCTDTAQVTVFVRMMMI